uniref:Vesicle transport protein n=1 Tax=Steinernema glaseri TaxID=37863 RepID=A0A1I7Z9Z8_9BILA
MPGSGSGSAPAPSGMIASGFSYVNRHPKCKMLSYVRTAIGIFTVLVIYSSAMSSLLTVTAFPIGIYLVVIGIPTCMLEFGVIIRMCCGTEGPLCKVFALVLGFDRWQRGCLYIVFAVVCFLPSISTMSGKMAGIFLLITGILYVVKTFQKKKVPTYVPDLSAHSVP